MNHNTCVVCSTNVANSATSCPTCGQPQGDDITPPTLTLPDQVKATIRQLTKRRSQRLSPLITARSCNAK